MSKSNKKKNNPMKYLHRPSKPIPTVNKTTDKDVERLKHIKNTIFNAATFSTSFIWLYLLEVYKEKLSMGIVTYKDIWKMIDVFNVDIREKKSIKQVYEYLVERYDKNELEGFLTIEKVKDIAPMYASYFEDSHIVSSNDA